MKRKMYFGEIGRWFLFLWGIGGLISVAFAYDTETGEGLGYLALWLMFWVAFIYGFIEGRHYERKSGRTPPSDDPDSDRYKQRKFHDIM